VNNDSILLRGHTSAFISQSSDHIFHHLFWISILSHTNFHRLYSAQYGLDSRFCPVYWRTKQDYDE
jgi:hypothetical protein